MVLLYCKHWLSELWIRNIFKVKIRNQLNKVPHLTQDTAWESAKYARKHHILGSQEVSPSPAGKQDCKTQTGHYSKHKHNRKKDPLMNVQ